MWSVALPVSMRRRCKCVIDDQGGHINDGTQNKTWIDKGNNQVVM